MDLGGGEGNVAELLPWRWVIKLGPHKEEPGQQKPGRQESVEQMVGGGLDMSGRAKRGTREPRAWTRCSPREEGQQRGSQRESPSYHQGGRERTSLNWHQEQRRAPFKEEYVRRDFRPGVRAGSRSPCLQLLFLVLSYGFLTK